MMKMDWQTFVNGLRGENTEDEFGFYPPVAPKNVLQFFRSFLYDLPEELGELYKQTNGISNTWQGKSIGWLIWPLEKMIEENVRMRTEENFKELYMPFDNLLFFADSGSGDLFGFVIINGQVLNTKIFVWNHENDSRNWVAPSLKIFVEWWQQGQIKV